MFPAQAFAIEIHGRSAGIVVADPGGFVFFAAESAFQALDRRVFKHVGQAERAAVQLLSGRTKQRAR
ncbi:MAG: hypothetical protein WCF85_03165 [Rhodospirillaceae bacterium]